MDFLELAEERYSVRKFKPDKVEDEKIEKILLAGRVAPTAENLQPQKILVLKEEEDLERFRRVTDCHFNAPLAFVVGYDKTLCSIREFDKKSSGEIDASIVATHMMLEAWDIGIGSTWVMRFDPDVAREVLNLPENFIPICLLPMGYAIDGARPSRLHKDKKEPTEIVYYGKFN